MNAWVLLGHPGWNCHGEVDAAVAAAAAVVVVAAVEEGCGMGPCDLSEESTKREKEKQKRGKGKIRQ